MKNIPGLKSKLSAYPVLAAYETYTSAFHANGARAEVQDRGDGKYTIVGYVLDYANDLPEDDSQERAAWHYWSVGGDPIRCDDFDDACHRAQGDPSWEFPQIGRKSPTDVTRIVRYNRWTLDQGHQHTIESYVRPDLKAEQAEVERIEDEALHDPEKFVFKPIYEGAKSPWVVGRDEYETMSEDEVRREW